MDSKSCHLPTFLAIVKNSDKKCTTKQYENYLCGSSDDVMPKPNRPCDLKSDIIPDEIKDLVEQTGIPSDYDHMSYQNIVTRYKKTFRILSESNRLCDAFYRQLRRSHVKTLGDILYDIANYQLSAPEDRGSIDFDDGVSGHSVNSEITRPYISVLAIVYELIYDQDPLCTYYHHNWWDQEGEFTIYIDWLVHYGYLLSDKDGHLSATGKINLEENDHTDQYVSWMTQYAIPGI